MRTFFFITFMGIVNVLFSQNIGIGTLNPHSSAVLEIHAANKGFLFPRMSEFKMSLIPNPAKSLVVFNTTRNAFMYYNENNEWKEFLQEEHASYLNDEDEDTKITVDSLGIDKDEIKFSINTKSIKFKQNAANKLQIEFLGTDNNILIGKDAGSDMFTGEGNIFLGHKTGHNNIDGSNNIQLGNYAGYNGWASGDNIMIGDSAGFFNNSFHNTFIGSNSGSNNVDGQHNTFIGYNSGNRNEADFNVSIGSFAGERNQNGEYNINLGYSAGKNAVSARVVNVGAFAGRAINGGQDIINIGYLAGEQSLRGKGNVNIGNEAGQFGKGNYSVNLGHRAGSLNSSGNNNVNIGNNTGLNNKRSRNTMIGSDAGKNNEQGSQNTFLGYYAGNSSEGSGNVFIGFSAGENELGSNKIYIDNSNTSSPLIGGDFADDNLVLNVGENGGDLSSLHIKTVGTNSHLVLDGNEVDAHNSPLYLNNNTDKNIIMVNGGGNVGIDRNATTNKLEVNGQASKSSAGDWVANSDARLKKNIMVLDSEKMLQQVIKMQGVEYEWNDKRPAQDRPSGKQYGFIAQDLQKVWPENVSEDAEGYLQTAYGTYDHLYVEAIKELFIQIKKLEKKLEVKETQVEQLYQAFSELKVLVTDNTRN